MHKKEIHRFRELYRDAIAFSLLAFLICHFNKRSIIILHTELCYFYGWPLSSGTASMIRFSYKIHND